jgi:hypothetical protein
MNTFKNQETAPRILLTSAITLASLWLAGCASTGYNRGDAAALSLQDTAADVQAESRAIDMTVSALDDLTKSPTGDLKLQFRSFSRSLDQLIAAAKRADATAARMELKHTLYFATWDKELPTITYEAIRNRSGARRDEVGQRFEAVDKGYHDAQTAVQPLIDYFGDIRRALSADLTMGGLASVKEIVGNADQNTGKVQVALGKVTNDLAASCSEMSSYATQNPGPRSAPAPASTKPQARDGS